MIQLVRTGFRRHLPAVAVFLVALVATLLVSWQLGQTAYAKDEERFRNASDRVQDAVLGRIEMYVAMLRAGAALFDVSPDGITDAQFREFVGRLELRERYPGIQGVGFTRRVAAADRPAFEASRRAADFPDFVIWEEDPPRDEYHAIIYLEPLDERNLRAIGYDMFNEDARREAMARARDTGAPAASAPVRLVQEIADEEVQQGFLIYMPVYAGGRWPLTVEERRERLLGFVYSPFRAGDLFDGIFGRGERPLAGFELFDLAAEEPFLYRTGAPDAPWFTVPREIEVEGRQWTLSIFSLEALEAGSSAPLVPLVRWAGVMVSLLLGGLVAAQTQARQRVEQQAETLTDLNAQVRQLLESERIARSEAERVSRLKDEFLATLSHELRTPLNAIQGWAHMLGMTTLPPERRSHAIEAILRSSQMQGRLIEDLLDMSRIISGRIRLEVHDVWLADVLDAAVSAVRPTAEARHVLLDVRVEEPPAIVPGDASRLQQVLWNLLSNAIKFTPAGGQVTVVQRVVQGQACVEVADNGHGIDPAFLPYVFERFRQADGSTTRRHGGLGLGLSIARSLVQMHGGTIEAASGGLDQGSTFIVRIPLAVATRTPDADVSRAPTLSRVPLSAGMLAGLSVLAVDDDEDARVLVRDILTAYGADVVVAADAETALELFRRRTRPFDLLVSDIGMPGMDGYALLRTLRVEVGDRPIAAVAVTAYASAEDSARVYAAGYRIHVPKPATPHEIVAACAIASERVVV